MRFSFLIAISLSAVLLWSYPAKAGVQSSIRQITLLDSGWQFKQGDPAHAEEAAANVTDWQPVSIPHCWGWEQAQAGNTNYYRGPGWYRRQVAVTPRSGKRYFLRFGAASSVADVYFNGRLLGQHRGAFGAFCFEITTNLSADDTNLLAVRVNNAAAEDIAPISGDFPVFGGMYRPVHLIEAGDECFALTDHASSGVAWLQKDVSDRRALLDVVAQVSNGTRKKSAVMLAARLLDAAGQEIASTNQTADSAADTTAPYWLRLVVPHPHLWNGRQDPYLYRAVVELRSADGTVLDSVEQPVGLRYYRVDPDHGFFLNGKAYPIHGVCRHQDRPNKGWAISESDMEEDIALMKEMGVTAVRCCHYEQSDYFYSLCDQAGILVWAEIPQVDGIHATPAFEETSRNQLLDLIRQNVNHPAIFVWSLFNEIGNGHTDDPHRELQDLNNTAHGEDPTRPTIAATSTDKFPQMNKIPDLLGRNTYPGWYWGKASPALFGEWLDKARYTSAHGGFCISEYGAGANPSQHEADPKQPKPGGQWHPEEWEDIVHEADWAAIRSHPFVWGSFLWNMFDFTSSWRHEGGTVGRNDKGLVTYDRKTRKDAFYFYQANWSGTPVLYITSRRFGARTNAVTDVKVYSNLPQATLSLNGQIIGAAMPNDECVAIWKSVRLVPGENRVEVRGRDKKASRELTDQCVWTLGAEKSRSAGQP